LQACPDDGGGDHENDGSNDGNKVVRLARWLAHGGDDDGQEVGGRKRSEVEFDDVKVAVSSSSSSLLLLLEGAVLEHLDHFLAPGGVVLLVYSALMTRGLVAVKKDLVEAVGVFDPEVVVYSMVGKRFSGSCPPPLLLGCLSLCC
jgi:hypothetical protein